MQVVINKCYGGFGLSEKAYLRLIELGVPVRKYITPQRGDDGLCQPEPDNDGEVIFDRCLDDGSDEFAVSMIRIGQRYWTAGWIRDNRNHPLLLEVVKDLGKDANGPHAELSVITIPDGIEYTIEEYDGIEHIAEKHRTWD